MLTRLTSSIIRRSFRNKRSIISCCLVNKSVYYLTTSYSHRFLQCGAVVTRRYISGTSSGGPDGKTSLVVVPNPTTPTPTPTTTAVTHDESFIPLTGRAIFSKLAQKPDLLTDGERVKFEEFSLLLDNSISNQFRGVLEDLKVLFDPINPDKETVRVLRFSEKEREEKEFWLLQKLAIVMEKANFRQLSKRSVETALKEHRTGEGVLVSVDPSKYSILKFWILGHEKAPGKDPWYMRVPMSIYFSLRGDNKSDVSRDDVYKRVVVAARRKGAQSLMLKVFKDIPVGGLEQLLPGGAIRMTKFDKGLLTMFGAVGGVSLLAKLVSYMAHVPVQWATVLIGATVLTGAQVWASYMRRRNRYLGQLSQMLYFKNIANNRGLLSLLVDRAKDELFKETLLVYSFLYAQRPPTYLDSFGSRDVALHGGITRTAVEQLIEEWVRDVAGRRVKFDATNSVRCLKGLGLVVQDTEDDPIQVLRLEQAMLQLPPVRQSMMGDMWQDLEIEPESFNSPTTIKSKLRNWTHGWF